MGHSQRLCFEEIRSAFRLVGELRELGGEPRQWRTHMLTELNRLVGGMVGQACETVLPALVPPDMIDLGWRTERERQAVVQYFREFGYVRDPEFNACLKLRDKFWTHTRREIITDGDWYASATYPVRKYCGVDDFIHSSLPLPGGGWQDTIQVNRAAGEKPFSIRERRLVHLIHEELARLWLEEPLSQQPEVMAALPPRQRQLLACLLQGDSESEAARRIGLSRHTAHSYVKILHRRLGVSSRAELIAKCAGFRPEFRPRFTMEARLAGAKTPKAPRR